MALTIVTQPTIAAGQSLSSVLNLSGQNVGLLRIICPAAWTGNAWLTFQMSNDNTTFYDAYDYTGLIFVSRVVPNAMVIVRQELWRMCLCEIPQRFARCAYSAARATHLHLRDGIIIMLYQQRAAPPPGGEPDEFVLSDGSLDRMGDVIEPGGWQLDQIKSDPPVLFNHDRDQIVGRWTDMRVKDGKLIGRIVWAKSDKWPMGQYIRDLVREGILRTVSVGFPAGCARAADQRRGPASRAVPFHQTAVARMLAGFSTGESECLGARQGSTARCPRRSLPQASRKLR